MHYTTIKEYAKAYSDLNLYTFPCHGIHSFSNTCTCGRSPCKDKGKHPKTDHGAKDATLDVDKFRYPTDPQDNELTNIGIATGERSKVIVIDEDETGAIEKLEAKYGKLPKTVTAMSGRGCPHYYFAYDPSFANVKNSKLLESENKIDVRCDGGYVIAPPAIHKSGNYYTWINDPESTPLATMPDWLVALLPRHEAKAIKQSTTLAASPRASQPIIVDDPNTFTIHDADAQRVAAYLATVPPAITGEYGMNGTWQLINKLVELFGHIRSNEQLLNDLEPWNATCIPPWDEYDLAKKIAESRAKHENVCQLEAPSGQLASKTTMTNDPLPWPTLNDHALTGLAGDIVRRIEPQTETDNAALLVTMLTSFGVAVGRNPYIIADGVHHHANLFACIVGRSSRARKGTSLTRIKDVMRDIMPPTMSGLSSGEGLINEVRDASTKPTKDGSFETIQGIDDKRLWIIEPEFSRTLGVIKRPDNILSSILRTAWDSCELRVTTRTNPLSATDTHIGMTTHITMDELSKTMNDGDAHNGFANRFMFCVVKSSKLLPDGGDDIELDDLRSRLRTVIDNAKLIGRMTRSSDCIILWRKAYPLLREEKTGTYDAITSRAEAITLRLSMLYALLDGSSTIHVQHLRAALALWIYCDHSAEYLFAPDRKSTTGAETRAKILELINDQTTTPTDNESNMTTITQTETPVTTTSAVTNKLTAITIQAATLAELFDYRNANGGRFMRDASGGIVLSCLDTTVPDAITQSVIENQTILESLVTEPKPPTINEPPSNGLTFTIADEPDSLASDPFIVAMRDADNPVQRADADIERRHNEAMDDPEYAKIYNLLLAV